MNNGPEPTPISKERIDGALSDAALEASLRGALRHTDSPSDFTERLIARVVAGEHPRAVPSLPEATPQPAREASKVLHWPPSRLVAGGAIAAALLLGILEGEVALKRFREQQRRITEATAQFQTTERVTVHALAQAREQLQKAGVPLALD